ncbi:MAG: hypothetical protein WBH03_13965, partial [Cyclobacteriaceae bacterium]
SYNNPIGIINMGEPVNPLDIMKPQYWLLTELTLLKIPYGGDCGGCRTYGDIVFTDNYWNSDSVLITEENWNKLTAELSKLGKDAYEAEELLDTLKKTVHELGDIIRWVEKQRGQPTGKPATAGDHASYSKQGFYSPCYFYDERTNLTYPTDTTFRNNHNITGIQDIPVTLLDSAGVMYR